MKFLIIFVIVTAVAMAEPPPSNSYLPPSSASRNGGYPQGPAGSSFGVAPQVVAARALGNVNGNGLARSAPHDHTHKEDSANLPKVMMKMQLPLPETP